jgi:predicted ATPase
MKLQQTSSRNISNSGFSDVCFLVSDNWDDFGFKTAFVAVLFDVLGIRHDLGFVRIMKAEMTHGRVQLNLTSLEYLDESYCSLGGDREYYVKLYKVPPHSRIAYLNAIRDCANNHSIFRKFENEQAMITSLLRDVSKRDVLRVFPRILAGDAQLTRYEFYFDFLADDGTAEKLSFSVRPDSKPPSNIHVLIGRNGVGKTRLLAGMADAVTENKAASIGLIGELSFADEEEQNEFLNLVIVSYSVFDKFDPIPEATGRTEKSIPHYYLGIKGRALDALDQGLTPSERVYIKDHAELVEEFRDSIRAVIGDAHRLERWERAIRTLASDPGINDMGVADLHPEEIESFSAALVDRFSNLSSGHKIVLLTMTKLVEVVSDRSLVLMDEPETHLHPPLLSSFIRALSELLKSRNAVAVIATHSPVVLQEVPSDCVQVISKSGDRLQISRPDVETFAENVGTLTRKVFGLEVEKSGFYGLLADEVSGATFEKIMKDFGNKVGGEGRALIRSFLTKEE